MYVQEKWHLDDHCWLCALLASFKRSKLRSVLLMCRAMPIPVIGSVSDPEAVGLGKLLEVHCRKQTGTLFNGIDIADDDYDTVAGYVRSFFVHRTGELIHALCCPQIQVLTS